MPALALLFLVGGMFVIRQVIVGRARETPTDLKDLSLALLSGDTSSVGTVMARRGSNTDAGSAATSVGTTSDGGAVSGALSASPLASEVKRLGDNATGYVSGTQGPAFYDCSGLVWRALYNLSIYKGPRFTTYNFEKIATKFAYKVDTPGTGDIVIWVGGHHMGVMISNTDFYSARDATKGIGSVPLSADIKYFNATPDYWRVGVQG